MNVIEKAIKEVVVFEPKVFGDERGFFMETFRQSWMEQIGVPLQFVQENHSLSRKGTLRGLHYQLQQPQGKLVRVVAGEVYDVAVDVRRSSPTFGQWVGEYLSAENKKMMWVPPGFAHGFYVVSESAEFLYKCTDYYAPEHERSLLWNDPNVGVEWPIGDEPPLLSDKDRQGLPLDQVDTFA